MSRERKNFSDRQKDGKQGERKLLLTKIPALHPTQREVVVKLSIPEINTKKVTVNLADLNHSKDLLTEKLSMMRRLKVIS